MELLKFFGKVEDDPGTPVVFAKGDTPEDTVSIVVRRIPVHVEQEMERKRKVNTQDVRMKRAHGEITVDGEVGVALNADKAGYCLLDTINWDIRVADESAAAIFSALKGETVVKGDLVRIDGLWSKTVPGHGTLKDMVIGRTPEFAQKIVMTAKRLDKIVEASLAEEQAGKGRS